MIFHLFIISSAVHASKLLVQFFFIIFVSPQTLQKKYERKKKIRESGQEALRETIGLTE